MDSHKTPSPIAVSETQSTNGVIWCECSMDPPADRSLCERTSLLSLSLSLGKVSIQLDCRCRHRRCQQQLQLLLLLLLLLCPARDSVKTLRLSETMRDTHASRNVSRFERRVNTTSFVCATEWSKAERERERGSEKKRETKRTKRDSSTKYISTEEKMTDEPRINEWIRHHPLPWLLQCYGMGTNINFNKMDK